MSGFLMCRRCGESTPDVGFTPAGDLRCDACHATEERARRSAVWRGFLTERGAVLAEREAD